MLINKINTALIVFALLAFVLCPVIVHAQPIPPEEAPLDPLSWIALGAAGMIAGRKYLQSKRQGNSE